MKLIILFFMLFTNVRPQSNNTIFARSYVVMDSYTNEVLEGKDINLIRSVASISKIMTAILALESDDLFKVIQADEEINKGVGSSIYLSIGDSITILDLVYGLMLRSGNDAALMIAKNVAKSVDEFVEQMNSKAKAIGMTNTIFYNPHGLDIYDQGNLSTSYDMALLMNYCLNNSLFVDITSSKSYTSPLKGKWVNKNKLLHSYEYLISGKTGYTYKAKRTLITAAEKNNQRLTIVTLDCGSDFAMHRNLYQKYFTGFVYILFLAKGKNFIDEYVIESSQFIGLRIESSSFKNGLKIYKIDVSNNTLTIQYVIENEVVFEKGPYYNIYLLNSYRYY